MEIIVKLDKKRRLVIPKHMRKIVEGEYVSVREEGRKLVVTPVKDPLEELSKRVSRKKPLRALDKVAEEEAAKSLRR